MMDDSRHKPVNNDSNADIDDWFAEFKCNIEPEVGDDTGIEYFRLQASLPDPNNPSQIDNIFVKLEEKPYQDAARKPNGFSGTCQSMMPMESLHYHGSSADSSNSVLIQTMKTEAADHGSCLPDMSSYSHEPAGNLVGQSVQSVIFSNTHGELPMSQPLQQVPQRQQQQLRQQLLKQNVQQAHIQSPLMQSNIQYGRQQQQEQHILSLPTELQSSQQPMFSTVQNQRQKGKLPNMAILQQNHQLGLLEKQQQLPPYQHNMSPTFKQSMGLQSNALGLHQQQFIGAQSDTLKIQPHQHALHIPQTSQPKQLHQLLGLQKRSNSLQESTQRMHQTLAGVHPHSANTGQQNQLEQAQRVLPESSSASLESTCQFEGERLADWHDEAYRKLELARELYLPEGIKLQKRARELSLQPPSAELAPKYERIRIFLDKTMKFLQLPRADIVHCSKDKFYHYLKIVTCYFNSVCSENPISAQQYGQQLHRPGSQSPHQLWQQINQKFQFHSVIPGPAGSPHPSGFPNSLKNRINSPYNGSLTRWESNSALSPLQPGSMHQYTVGRPQQTNIINSLHHGSFNGIEQRNASEPLRHSGVRSLQSNMLSTLHQTNFSHMTTSGALDPSKSSLPSSSTVPFLNSKQQNKHQMLQSQMLKQPMQWPLAEQRKQQMFDEPKVGQGMGCSSGLLQNHHSIGQPMEPSSQSLLPPTSHLSTDSPQTPQDQKNLLTPLSKAGTPLQFAASPFNFPSPSTPLTPPSLVLDHEKHSSGISPSSIAENNEHPQTTVEVSQSQSQDTIQNQFLAIGTPEMLPSPLLPEGTSLEDNQKTNAKEPSLKCLIDMVESISPRAFNAAVRDIGSVIGMIDRIAGTTPSSESKVAIGNDLAADTGHRLQKGNFTLYCGNSPTKRMRRHISTTALDSLSSTLNENDDLEWFCQTPDVESTATSRIKRLRSEPSGALLEEIKEINQKFLETTIAVVSDSTEDAAKTFFGKGTIVRCSYNALGLGGIFKKQNASPRMLPILPVQLLVPEDYPISSPILLDTPSIGWSEAIESENLSEKAKLRFSLSLGQLSQPISVGDMVKTWDVCARAVFSEFAQSTGGGSFSSTYGTWESCVTAA